MDGGDAMVRLIRWLFRALGVIAPWLLRFIGWLTMLVFNTIASLWVGVPNSVRTISDDWVDQAVTAGVPTEYDSILYYMFAFVSFFLIMMGWIVFSFITVGLILWIF